MAVAAGFEFNPRVLRWPAEWEPHRRCFSAWPDNQSEWGAALEPSRAAVATMCRAIAAGEPVVLLVDRSELEAVRRRVADDRVEVRRQRCGDIWLRDSGPIFRWRGASLVALAFRWTGWGGKFVMEGDDEVACAVAAIAGAPLSRSPIAAEGGGIEGDGAGAALTTRECLLHPARNPGTAAAAIEAALAEALAIERLIWLERGLVGDHTDGHIDNLARFVAPGRVVCARPGDPGDPNRAIHAEVLAALEAAGLDVALLPSPGLVPGPDGPLAASYLNFYLANGRVVAPAFERPSDDEAHAALAALFPEREVVGVASTALLYGGGGIHCITQPEPLGPTP
jgi:agmatine deiminase